MQRTQVYLDEDQDRQLARRARSVGVTKSFLIREAIAEYLAAPDDDARLAGFQAALDELASDPLAVPDGATFVEAIRALDDERRLLLEQRR